MPKSSSPLSTSLTRSHLEAIGSVAAQWSSLESSMISAICKVAATNLHVTVVLAGPSAFASWVDMLIVFARSSEDHKHKEKMLDSLCHLLLKLQRLRNYIVHASWMDQKRGIGLIARVMDPGITSAKDKAKGIGIPKRGRDVLVFVHWTAPQMRAVAKLIEKARLMLVELSHRQKPTSPQERLAHALMDQTILRRIRTMLDSLPDPFQK
ncbi:MAG: hypothetical protein EWM72_03133 [Nitrospira sp.]|nr:MAG: hypothetical protein EWM72_03133 [Nitrospira sp.]